MEKQQAVILDLQMYKSQIHVLHNFDDEQLKEYTDTHFPGIKFPRNPVQVAAAYFFENLEEGLRGYMIDFKRKLNYKNAETHGTIAHEVYHVVSEIFNDLGIPLGYENQEAFAYCQGHIIKKINQEILGLK